VLRGYGRVGGRTIDNCYSNSGYGGKTVGSK